MAKLENRVAMRPGFHVLAARQTGLNTNCQASVWRGRCVAPHSLSDLDLSAAKKGKITARFFATIHQV